jgi:hypothetical protein
MIESSDNLSGITILKRYPYKINTVLRKTYSSVLMIIALLLFSLFSSSGDMLGICIGLLVLIIIGGFGYTSYKEYEVEQRILDKEHFIVVFEDGILFHIEDPTNHHYFDNARYTWDQVLAIEISNYRSGTNLVFKLKEGMIFICFTNLLNANQLFKDVEDRLGNVEHK